MHDLPNAPEEKTTYECLQCGALIAAASHPMDCPECGCVMQGQTNSLE